MINSELVRKKELKLKNTVTTFYNAKQNGEKLTMLTAYDYSTAKLIDEAGVNSILVGDSLGNVILVYEDMLGMFSDFKPKFVKHFADVGEIMKVAFKIYCCEVQ